MNVAVVDVGSNTIRLLVATRSGTGVACLAQGKRSVGLGEDVERLGVVSAAKLAEAGECLAAFAAIAHAAGADALEVVVASPGRQARNADQLVHALSRAAGVRVRVLSWAEEARLAFEGALAQAAPRGAVAVCDVGGGSTQLAVGTAAGGPAWLRSVDLGSLRLSARVSAGDPPSKGDVARLRAEARAALAHVIPPLPGEALAVGGTARTLKQLVGRTLGAEGLRGALRLLRKESSRALAARYGIDDWRARALPAGTVILLEVQELLGVPLEVGRGGLREGLALELLHGLSATQAEGGAR
jgi:exopolyphosphatase/guanosine-5'-triphosphate,3'-diphosphate pyrophosphatase